MLRRTLFLTLTLLFSTLSVAVGQRGEWDVVQPLESPSGLVLMSQPGRARIEFDGRVRALSLRPSEELTTVAEVRSGWVAAGRRVGDVGRELVVLTNDSQGFRRLQPPGDRTGALRVRPRILTREARLAGLAWLEGDGPRNLEVRVAEWTGADWGVVRTISGRGPGSQTGLAGTTLTDGSALLVWSAFDGSDDEIVFSRQEGSGWTSPRRLAAGNRVPDVAPALIATRHGALAAWSRRDEDEYRLVVAAYRDGRWQSPRTVAHGGAVFPTFVRLDERILLLHRTAEPRGWAVLELGAMGRIRRRTGLDHEDPERPALSLEGNGDVGFRWSGRTVESVGWSAR